MNKEMPAWKESAFRKFLELYRNYKAETKKTDEQIADEIGMYLNTMKYTLSGKGFSLDFAVSFCLTYDIDINYLFSDVQDASAFVGFQLSRDCHPLEDAAFFGTFYGYCRNSQGDHRLEHFVLRISADGRNGARATFTLYGRNQKGESVTKVLTGKPMHLKPDIIYIVLQSERGDDMFYLEYNWFQVGPGKSLYFRSGGTIIPTRDIKKHGQMQRFVMLDKPIPQKHMHYVDGATRMDQDLIIVPAERYDGESGGLMATDEQVQAFFRQCDDLNFTKKEVYFFDERILTTMGTVRGVDDFTTAAAILSLKANSLTPKVVDLPDSRLYSKFFPHLAEDTDE